MRKKYQAQHTGGENIDLDSFGGNMKKSIFIVLVLSLCTLQSAKTVENASFAQQGATIDMQLPNLHRALIKQEKSTSSLIEFLEHLVTTHHTAKTWNLKDGARDFTRDLLQILNTIEGEQPDQTACTILLQGNPGTLPISLLAAGLFWMGKNDVSIQLISNDHIPSRSQLHKIIRTFLSKSDRCFVQQFDDIVSFTKASRSCLRIPNIVISFTGQPELLNTTLHHPLTFDYTNRTVK